MMKDNKCLSPLSIFHFNNNKNNNSKHLEYIKCYDTCYLFFKMLKDPVMKIGKYGRI